MKIYDFNQCKPDDLTCLKEKLNPLPNFIDKLTRKMTYKGCPVSPSERIDAWRAVVSVSDSKSFDLSALKSVLLATCSKTDRCDKVFEESWRELLFPHQVVVSTGRNISPALKPIMEKILKEFVSEAQSKPSFIVDPKEMAELIERGKLAPQTDSNLQNKADELARCFTDAPEVTCLKKLRDELINQMKEALNSGKLSQLVNIGSQLKDFLELLKLSNPSSIETLKEISFLVKNELDNVIKNLDVVPSFDDFEQEKQFIDNFLKGGLNNWGSPRFVKMVTDLGYFKARIRDSLKKLKSKKGIKEQTSTRGKFIHPAHTFAVAMRKGALLDLWYKKIPPKQKEDIVWLVDTSGSMESAYAFIQPIVDGLNNLGIKQKFFLGTEGGLKVSPHSDFMETLSKLKSTGTALSNAIDDVLNDIKTFNKKTFILYSDMEDSDKDKLKSKIHSIVAQGGRAVLLNSTSSPLFKEQKIKDTIVEFTDIDNYNSLLDALNKAKPIIVRRR